MVEQSGLTDHELLQRVANENMTQSKGTYVASIDKTIDNVIKEYVH